MPNNPLTLAELQSYAGSAVGGIVQMPSGYIFATPVSGTGPIAYRLFDAGYITLGTINVNRLGTGATGAGTRFLADDNTWKIVSGGSSGVSSFNTRTGVVTLNSTDVTTALGFTPPTTLNALNDVTTPTPVDGQLLRFNSAKYFLLWGFNNPVYIRIANAIAITVIMDCNLFIQYLRR